MERVSNHGTIWLQKIFVSQKIFRLTNMQVVYTDVPLGYSASFPHLSPVFPSTLFSHPFSCSSSFHLPFHHPSFISIVSTSPHHPPFFFIPLLLFFHSPSPFFYSLFFIISVSPILFPDFHLSPSPFSFPQPLHFDYLSESPSSCLFFSLLPFPVLSLCPAPLHVPLFLLLHSSSLISPFPPPLHFSLPLFCTLSVSDFPITFSTPAACTEL